MRRPRILETFGAALLAAGVVVAPVVGPVPVSTAEAADVEWFSADFEDGLVGSFTGNGSDLAVIDTDSHGGLRSLAVTGRGAAWEAPHVDLLAEDLVPGTYSVTAWVKLAPDAPVDATGVNLTVHQTPADATIPGDEYKTVGDYRVPVGKAAWVQVGGSYTLDETRTAATLYVDVQSQVVDSTTVHPEILVDDVLVVGPEAVPTVEEIWNLDFDTSSVAPWTVNPAGVTSFVPDGDGGQALAITRADNWHGIESPAGKLALDTEYTVSFRVRLPELSSGTRGLRLVAKSATSGNTLYQWVGNTTVDASGWSNVTATLTVPSTTTVDSTAVTVTAGSTQLYVGSDGAAADAYTFHIDDILVTGPATTDPGDGWTPDLEGFIPGGAAAPTETPVTAARGEGLVAALTFDDGPEAPETTDMLQVLADNDVTATFCLIGSQVTARPDIVQAIVAGGHTLCAHSMGWSSMNTMTRDEIEADLKANLAAIRTAVGDPGYPVPYFRAPNVAWGDGRVAEVAAALGMQPLGFGNGIADWEDPANDLSEATLTTNLSDAITPGAVVTAHVGGGDRSNTVNAAATVIPQKIAEGYTFTLPEGGAADTVRYEFDFEDGLQGWTARANADGPATVAVTTADAHGGAQSALVSERVSQGQGIGLDVTDLLTPGATYDVTAWLKFAGQPTDDIWLSVAQGTTGTTFTTVEQLPGMSADTWVEVSVPFTMTSADYVYLYFETPYENGAAGTTTSFMVDDIVISSQEAAVIEDLPSIAAAHADLFPVGVAVDARETVGSPAELTLLHFNQLTAENHMKVESWYDAPWSFRMHDQAIAVMDFAQANDLRYYGHVLVWHSQTPDWFFQDAEGDFLTSADRAVMIERLETHIDNVAKAIHDRYGDFGSATNPLVAWDVVNEVVDDQANAATGGLRNSRWYQILGEDFIDLAFAAADRAFNDTYAVPDTEVERPVTLFINDYNTEQSGKQNRYYDLVTRLLGRGVPLDGVGHQFHVSLAMPVANLEGALARFADLPVVQAVTELDVTVGANPTEALRIEQGYYYRDAFRAFRAHAEDLFSVTVWGLSDNRSWRSTEVPLVFDGGLQAKPAYYGIMEGDLAPRIRTANVFAGDVALADGATQSLEWRKLPLHPIEDVGEFQLRWAADHLTAYASVDDPTVDAGDVVTFEYGAAVVDVARDGSGDVAAVVAERRGGYDVVAHLPGTFAQGGTVQFDARVGDGGTEAVAGWNSLGATGTLTLVEPLSFTTVAQAPVAPTVDGAVDDVWSLAQVVTTGTQVSGAADGAATADVRTLWSGDGQTLYVLLDVADDQLNADASNPWDQDSVEIYVDRGNAKNGSYRYDDSQIRIDFQGDVSFGTGDEAFQERTIDYAVATRDGGYVVEVAIDLLEAYGGPGTFHGVDFQVNDATDGTRTSIRNWADPTGTGYQTTAHWGVAKLAPTAAPDGPKVTLGLGEVKAGGTVPVTLEGFAPGETVELYLSTTGLAALGVGVAAAPGDILLGTAVMDAEGAASGSVTIPAGTTPGAYFVNVETNGAVAASAPLRVLAADPAAPGGGTGGNLPRTGSDALGMLLTALLLVGAGAGLLAARRPSRRGTMA